MSALTELLTAFPNARVTLTSRSRPSRPKPREFDEKVTKSRGVLIRVRRRGYGAGNQFIGYQVRNGRPLYDWMPEASLNEDQRKELEWARKLRVRENQST